jgi:hypothetical protein
VSRLRFLHAGHDITDKGGMRLNDLLFRVVHNLIIRAAAVAR